MESSYPEQTTKTAVADELALAVPDHEESVDKFQVKYNLFDFSPLGTQSYRNLNVAVRKRLDNGKFVNSTFTLKWHGRGTVHLPEVYPEEIQFCDDLGGEDAKEIAGNTKLLLAVRNTPFAAGGFGEIFHGITNRGLRVVVKKWKGKEPTLESVASAYFEAFLSANFTHPNILDLLNIVRVPNQPPWLVYRYMKHGCLGDVLQNTELLKTQKAKLKITKDIAHGMLYLHRQRCMHRDLTLKNVLIDKDTDAAGGSVVARITDFGLTTFLDGKNSSLVMLPRKRESDSRRIAYSLFYTAPEVLPIYEKTERRPSIPHIDWDYLFPPEVTSAEGTSENPQEEKEDTERSARGVADQEAKIPDTVVFPSPPEFVTLEPQGKYSFKSDVWSFGVVIHQIWTESTYEPFANTNYDLGVDEVKQMLSDYNFRRLYTPSDQSDSVVAQNDRRIILAIVNRAFGGRPRECNPEPEFPEVKSVLKKKLVELLAPANGVCSITDILEGNFSRIVEEVFGKNPSPKLNSIQVRLGEELARILADMTLQRKMRSPADFVPVQQDVLSSLLRKIFDGNPKRRPSFFKIIDVLERV